MAIDLAELLVADADAWHGWLADNGAGAPGVWLVLAKKDTTHPTRLRYDDALEVALCFGWIDGQVGRRDEATYRQRFTPRRSRSAWSQRNVTIAERLLAQGRMRPAGLAEIDRARADGRWSAAYAGPATAQVPADLAAALGANPQALETFGGLSAQNRYAILYRLGQLKRVDSRARRITTYVDMLARGETIYPQG